MRFWSGLLRLINFFLCFWFKLRRHVDFFLINRLCFISLSFLFNFIRPIDFSFFLDLFRPIDFSFFFNLFHPLNLSFLLDSVYFISFFTFIRWSLDLNIRRRHNLRRLQFYNRPIHTRLKHQLVILRPHSHPVKLATIA